MYSSKCWQLPEMYYFFTACKTYSIIHFQGRRGHVVVGFSTICAVNAYHHVHDEVNAVTTLCDIHSLSVPCDRSVVSSTNKTDRHDITEILLEVTLRPS